MTFNINFYLIWRFRCLVWWQKSPQNVFQNVSFAIHCSRYLLIWLMMVPKSFHHIFSAFLYLLGRKHTKVWNSNLLSTAEKRRNHLTMGINQPRNQLKLENLDILIKWLEICHKLDVISAVCLDKEGDWRLKIDINKDSSSCGEYIAAQTASLYSASVQLINKSDQKTNTNKFY